MADTTESAIETAFLDAISNRLLSRLIAPSPT